MVIIDVINSNISDSAGHKNFRMFGDNFRMLVTFFEFLDVGDVNGQNRHQHLEVFGNTFRFQHRCSRLFCTKSGSIALRVDRLA